MHSGDVTYFFTPTGFNTMVMKPSIPSQSSLHYNIEVNMNCFIPTCSITTIRRGGDTAEGEIVGEFEMGICSVEGRVLFHNKEFPLTQIFNNHKVSHRMGIGGSSKDRWRWHREPHHLVWTKEGEGHTVRTIWPP
ncbi:hypothetical protein K474DRAFT_311499 [Panus rudis PR-1116 ss-1]|nr:hypothetical protein K474DRAFT_311499 [Panus rudis PR-1116 ss-1]